MKYNFIDVEQGITTQFNNSEDARKALAATRSAEAWIERVPENSRDFIRLALLENQEISIAGDFDDEMGYHQVGGYKLPGETVTQIWDNALTFMRENVGRIYYLCLERTDGERWVL